MLIKQIIETFDVLDSSTVTGKDVENYLRGIKADADIEVYELKGPKGSTDMVKVRIPGTRGKTNGGDAPTIGLLGRLGGIGARPEMIGFVSDGDGALAAIAAAAKLLDMQNMLHLKDEIASSLPYGLQRRVEIARALATEPQLLLLDEPAAGMNPQETLELTDFIKEIKEKYNLSIFMIEHHMDLVMQISDRIYVLDFGKTIASGTPEEIQENPHVIDAYLGVADDAEN